MRASPPVGYTIILIERIETCLRTYEEVESVGERRIDEDAQMLRVTFVLDPGIPSLTIPLQLPTDSQAVTKQVDLGTVCCTLGQQCDSLARRGHPGSNGIASQTNTVAL